MSGAGCQGLIVGDGSIRRRRSAFYISCFTFDILHFMRVLRATTISRKYKAYYYRHHPREAAKPYAEQVRDFEWDSYAEVGLWKLNLEKIPGYTVEEHYINQGQLQRQWAKEHNVSLGADPVRDIITAQVAAFRPDVIFEDDDQYFNPAFREKL